MNWIRRQMCFLFHTAEWCGLWEDNSRRPAGEHVLRCRVCGRGWLVTPDCRARAAQ